MKETTPPWEQAAIDALRNHEFDYDPAAWQQMQGLLDGASGASASTTATAASAEGGTIALAVKWLAAVVIFTGLTTAIYFGSNLETAETVPPASSSLHPEVSTSVVKPLPIKIPASRTVQTVSTNETLKLSEPRLVAPPAPPSAPDTLASPKELRPPRPAKVRVAPLDRLPPRPLRTNSAAALDELAQTLRPRPTERHRPTLFPVVKEKY